jgi:hypothetical protein
MSKGPVTGDAAEIPDCFEHGRDDTRIEAEQVHGQRAIRMLAVPSPTGLDEAEFAVGCAEDRAERTSGTARSAIEQHRVRSGRWRGRRVRGAGGEQFPADDTS